MILVLNQSPNSTVFTIVQFPGGAKTVLSGDPLYYIHFETFIELDITNSDIFTRIADVSANVIESLLYLYIRTSLHKVNIFIIKKNILSVHTKLQPK